MANQDPFDPIIDEIAKLLSFARENAGEKFKDTAMEASIEKRLELLEDAIIKLNKIADDEVAKKNLTNKDIVSIMIEGTDKLPKADKRMVDKTLAISREALSMKYALALAEMKKRHPGRFEKGKSNPKDTKKRAAKFKNTQGNKTWKKI